MVNILGLVTEVQRLNVTLKGAYKRGQVAS